MKEFIKINLNIILTWAFILVVAVLGSIFVNLGMEWFNELFKPKEWIPNFVIPIVWTIIYVLFAIIFVFLYKNKLVTLKIIVLGIVNGILNILWCLIFFTLNQLLLGNVFIILNAVFGTMLLVEINKSNVWYAKLLWIYPIWLFVASTLNLAVWILN